MRAEGMDVGVCKGRTESVAAGGDRWKAHWRIRDTVLTKDVVVRLADYVARQRYDHGAVALALAQSLVQHPPSDPAARHSAGIWVDEMFNNEDHELRAALAAAFLESGLGSGERAAAEARDWLRDPASAAVACEVLAEAGCLQDIPLLWRYTHDPALLDGRLEPRIAHVEALSKGWLAIVRLAAPAESWS